MENRNNPPAIQDNPPALQDSDVNFFLKTSQTAYETQSLNRHLVRQPMKNTLSNVLLNT